MAVIPMAAALKSGRHNVYLLLGLQLIIIAVYGACVRYGDRIYPQEGVDDKVTAKRIYPDNSTDSTEDPSYMMFIDVHVMVFVGFGFLMTFMRRYVFGGVGFNFMVAALMVQWAICTIGFFHFDDNFKIQVNVKSLLEADIATATVLISMGAVLGRTTYIQLVVMGFIELVLQSANVYLNEKIFMAADRGDSIFVHTFGAYFGLAVGFILNLRRKYKPEPEEMESSYNSDALAMIGTLFLWIFWPSFNGSADIHDKMFRAIINTYLSLASCCVTSFIVSWLVSEERKFDMVHIQNSTLAGGVAVGAIGNLVLEPAGALAVGIVAGVLSVCGYRYLTPLLDKIKVTDTCGVHNLHGMPGVLSGLLSVLMAATATTGTYRTSLYYHYEAMAPAGDAPEDPNMSMAIPKGLGRSSLQQAGYQAVALVCTLVISIVGGLLTGALLSFKLFEGEKDDKKHDDRFCWTVHDPTLTPVNREANP